MSISRRAYDKGWCPCCQDTFGTLSDPESPAKVIGEGVRICGACVDRGHDDPEIVSALLAELIA